MATKTKTTAPDRTADALKLLEEGIQRLTSSEEWTKWLRAQSLFTSYSFSNTILISSQIEGATRVAGFNTWKKLGRSVMKGQKALWILAPMFRTKAKTAENQDGDQDDEVKVRCFRPVPVWDVSQTDGEPLPQVVKKLEGNDDGGLFEKLMAFSEARGVQVKVEAIAGSANGFFAPAEHRIVIREGLAPTQAAKTLCHEVAHSILHQDIETYLAHRPDCELEAESTAFVVLHHHGIDAGGYSFGYVATWQGGDEVAIKALKTCAARIQATARAIIGG